MRYLNFEIIKNYLRKIYFDNLFKDLIYKICLIFAVLVLFRLLILQEFINTMNNIVNPLMERLENIENSELLQNPLEKIKKKSRMPPKIHSMNKILMR